MVVEEVLDLVVIVSDGIEIKSTGGVSGLIDGEVELVFDLSSGWMEAMEGIGQRSSGEATKKLFW